MKLRAPNVQQTTLTTMVWVKVCLQTYTLRNLCAMSQVKGSARDRLKWECDILYSNSPAEVGESNRVCACQLS